MQASQEEESKDILAHSEYPSSKESELSSEPNFSAHDQEVVELPSLNAVKRDTRLRKKTGNFQKGSQYQFVTC